MPPLAIADREKIDALRSALIEAIIAGDPASYSQCFTEDGIVMHPDTAFVRGTGALRDYARGVFAAVKVTRLVLTPVMLHGTDTLAFEVGTQELAITPASDKFRSNRQHLHVYEKQTDGSWKIAAAMSGNQ